MDPLSNDLNFIDSHAHINLLQDPPEIIEQRCAQESIKWVLVPGFNLQSSKDALNYADRFRYIIPAVGVHPHDAVQDWNTPVSVIREYISTHHVAGIGEIGLDGVRSLSDPHDQIKLFEEQLLIAREYHLPVIIHNREKDNQIDKILEHFPDLKGILHCYSSSEQLALKKSQQGWLISFSYNITYPKSDFLRQLIKKLPLESLLLETDSPYMPPLSDRGKRNNSPVNIPALYRWASEWLSVPLEVLCQQLLWNFETLFSTYLEKKHG